MVAGCFKNAVLMVFGMANGDIVSPTQWFGFLLSTGGFLLYTLYQRESNKTKGAGPYQKNA